ncbi:MAG: mannosyltransferase family protein, partial [Streptomycetales bacterium]
APESSGPPPRAPWLAGTDRAALRLWLLTRVATWVLVGCAGWLFVRDAGAAGPVPLLRRWAQWDWVHYQSIAEFGYGGNPESGPLVPYEAFFPGFPLLLKAVHVVVPHWIVAGLLISLVAGGVAVVALGRLAEVEHPAGTGERAVLLLLLAPTAVFLAAGYTEAIFLALALPAWLMARRGDWARAALLAAGACTIRVSGIFLAAALVVEFLTVAERRRWRSAPWLALPALPVVGYMAYQYARTGDWLAWLHAQQEEWHRGFTNPVQAFLHTWEAAFGGGQPPGFAWMFRAEMLAVLVGVALTAVLLARRRWGEATFVGLQIVAFTTSYWYMSVPRAMLLWWPLWIWLAWWSIRRPAVLTAYLALVAPLMVACTLNFAVGNWTG